MNQLEYPCWSRQERLPFSALAKQGIVEDDELSPDGGDGDFCWFAGRFEPLVDGLEVWIEAAGDEGGYVECLADISPAAADEGAAGPLP